MKTEVLNTIDQIKSLVEREIEWPLTDHFEREEVATFITSIYNNLQYLEEMAESLS